MLALFAYFNPISDNIYRIKVVPSLLGYSWLHIFHWMTVCIRKLPEVLSSQFMQGNSTGKIREICVHLIFKSNTAKVIR